MIKSWSVRFVPSTLPVIVTFPSLAVSVSIVIALSASDVRTTSPVIETSAVAASDVWISPFKVIAPAPVSYTHLTLPTNREV